MTTSSAPVALRAASEKSLAAVPKYRQGTGIRFPLLWKQLWQRPQASAAWRRWSGMPPTRQHLIPVPISSSGKVRCSTAPPKSHEVGGPGFGYAGRELPGATAHRSQRCRGITQNGERGSAKPKADTGSGSARVARRGACAPGGPESGKAPRGPASAPRARSELSHIA